MGSARRSWSLSTIALVLGAILTASGLFLLGLYLAGVVDVVIDQPADRSWLFWGLGVAFIGVTLLVGGVALIVVWWRTRSDREPD
jgi:membrane protein implicated in regulation of membrane protease activity